MKLNPDCIRAILLYLEENQKIDATNGRIKPIPWASHLPETITDFSAEDIMYSVKQMSEAGLINTSQYRAVNKIDYIFNDITPYGHEFLENIRTEENWSKTKTTAEKLGNFSLSVLGKIAEGVATATLNKVLGLSQ